MHFQTDKAALGEAQSKDDYEPGQCDQGHLTARGLERFTMAQHAETVHWRTGLECAHSVK